MKKTLLLIALGAATSVFAQAQISKHPEATAEKMTYEQSKGIDNANQNSTFLPGTTSKSSLGKFRPDIYNFVQIGNSFYDLQTNASVGNRAMLHSDGTITMAWTISTATSSSWPDRGTGINHYNGTAWGGFPTARTENTRTGWPSIGTLADGKMYTMAHDFTDGGIIMTTNSGKGKTDWTTLPEILTYPGGEPIWNRTANNGDIMHTITNFSGQTGVADVIIDGITNPTTYSRSKDGGKTWETKHILLPGYDTSRWKNGGADAYAITTKDSLVAIVYSGIGKDVTLFKSTNNGDSWTTIIVDSFPFPAYTWGDEFIPNDAPVLTNDGSVDVVFDNNNKIHIAFGLLGISDEDTTDESISLARSFNLAHWSEATGEIVACATPIDMDNGGVDANGNLWDITRETTAGLTSTGTVPDGIQYAARYGNTGICSHPSIGVDSKNRIFITYDAPVELITNDYNANFRDIHIVFSDDDGSSWSEPQNATQLRFQEAVFACQTKRVDNFVHFLFQQDDFPGTNLQNNGNTGLHPNVEQIIQYAAIPVQDIIDGKLGQHNLSAKPIDYDSKVFVVSQNYPNPFSATTNVVIYMRNGSDLSYTISDASGKVVSTQEFGFQGAGNHEVQIDANNLSNGIYFYTLRTKDSEVTRKMNVVK